MFWTQMIENPNVMFLSKTQDILVVFDPQKLFGAKKILLKLFLGSKNVF